LAGSPVISFRCECGDASCRRTIPLSPASYRERRTHDEPVLYPGHDLMAASVATRVASWASDGHGAPADVPEDEALTAERDWLARRVDAG
jgi:hypothetical protein